MRYAQCFLLLLAFLSAGVGIPASESSGDFPSPPSLPSLIQAGSLEAIRDAVERPSGVAEFRTAEGRTLLWFACRHPQAAEVIPLLVAAGIPINHQDQLGDTALHAEWTSHRWSPAAQALADHGADFRLANANGNAVLDLVWGREPLLLTYNWEGVVIYLRGNVAPCYPYVRLFSPWWVAALLILAGGLHGGWRRRRHRRGMVLASPLHWPALDLPPGAQLNATETTDYHRWRAAADPWAGWLAWALLTLVAMAVFFSLDPFALRLVRELAMDRALHSEWELYGLFGIWMNLGTDPRLSTIAPRLILFAALTAGVWSLCRVRWPRLRFYTGALLVILLLLQGYLLATVAWMAGAWLHLADLATVCILATVVVAVATGQVIWHLAALYRVQRLLDRIRKRMQPQPLGPESENTGINSAPGWDQAPRQ